MSPEPWHTGLVLHVRDKKAVTGVDVARLIWRREGKLSRGRERR
jgi:hypothetical protein